MTSGGSVPVFAPDSARDVVRAPADEFFSTRQADRSKGRKDIRMMADKKDRILSPTNFDREKQKSKTLNLAFGLIFFLSFFTLKPAASQRNSVR